MIQNQTNLDKKLKQWKKINVCHKIIIYNFIITLLI